MKTQFLKTMGVFILFMSFSTSGFAQYIQAPTSVADFSYSFRTPKTCIQTERPDGGDCTKWVDDHIADCSNIPWLDSERYSKCIFQNLNLLDGQIVRSEGVVSQLLDATNQLIDNEARMQSEVLSLVSLEIRRQIKAEVLAEVKAEIIGRLKKDGVRK